MQKTDMSVECISSHSSFGFKAVAVLTPTELSLMYLPRTNLVREVTALECFDPCDLCANSFSFDLITNHRCTFLLFWKFMQ